MLSYTPRNFMNIQEEALIHCPGCDDLFAGDDRRKIPYATSSVKESWKDEKLKSIHFCPNCELGIAFPRLNDEEIHRIYADGDYWRSYRSGILWPRKDPGQYANALARWQCVERFLRKSRADFSGRILDIGGGHGFFGMAACRSRTYKIQKFCVVESDKYFRESLQWTWQKLYPKVTFQVGKTLDDIEGNFDVIVLSHILEHLNDPRKMIHAAEKRLTRDGCLYVDVPHQDFRFKEDVFPHVLFYNPKSLEAMFQRTRLKVQYLGIYGWPYQASPVHHRDQRRIWMLIEKIFYAFRALIPAAISRHFFSWYLGTTREHPQGTWIRLIAKNRPVAR
jgi:SAM-dependent methyltransferase